MDASVLGNWQNARMDLIRLLVCFPEAYKKIISSPLLTKINNIPKKHR
jgi:hypothetical protein